jgi:hypothetical protein
MQVEPLVGFMHLTGESLIQRLLLIGVWSYQNQQGSAFLLQGLG